MMFKNCIICFNVSYWTNVNSGLSFKKTNCHIYIYIYIGLSVMFLLSFYLLLKRWKMINDLHMFLPFTIYVNIVYYKLIFFILASVIWQLIQDRISSLTVWQGLLFLFQIIAVSCLIHQQFHMNKPAPKPHFEQHFCSK